jgi:hypothetical protein
LTPGKYGKQRKTILVTKKIWKTKNNRMKITKHVEQIKTESVRNTKRRTNGGETMEKMNLEVAPLL